MGLSHDVYLSPTPPPLPHPHKKKKEKTNNDEHHSRKLLVTEKTRPRNVRGFDWHLANPEGYL